jgi:A/G-specific adenine glycosylase
VKKLITGWVAEIVPKDRPGDFNQAMMELGATVCLPNGLPKCESCPVAFLCEAHLQGRISEFPVKAGKAQRKVEKKTVLVLLDKSDGSSGASPGPSFRTALRKRPEAGLLAGLWEFPNFDGELSEDEIRQLLDSYGLTISSLTKLKKAKHIFSHIEWHMIAYLAETGVAASGKEFSTGAESIINENPAPYGTDCCHSPEFQWVGIGLLDEKLALPAAFKTYYQILKGHISDES